MRGSFGVGMGSKTHQRLFVLAGLILSIVVGGFTDINANGVPDREIHIKVLDGRNGRPVGNECVNVLVSSMPPGSWALVIATDEEGLALLRLTERASEVGNRQYGSACGGKASIDPVVKYGDTISVLPGSIDCRPHARNNGSSILWRYSLEGVLKSGLDTGNSCGKVQVSPKPGELILYVRPRHWWERGLD